MNDSTELPNDESRDILSINDTMSHNWSTIIKRMFSHVKRVRPTQHTMVFNTTKGSDKILSIRTKAFY